MPSRVPPLDSFEKVVEALRKGAMRLANKDARIEKEPDASTLSIWYWRYLEQSTEPLIVALREGIERNPMLMFVLACATL